jgi:branched-subunit amino acid ABC-type transport system permease component
MYVLVALGFTPSFGVLNVSQFADGDVLTAGAFAGLAAYALALRAGMHAVLPRLVTFVLLHYQSASRFGCAHQVVGGNATP